MPLRLARVALREIRLPLVEPFRTAGGMVATRRVLLAELTDVDGRTVWSECVAEGRPSYSADTVDTCWLALTEWILPTVVGAWFADPSALHAAVARQVRGHQMARATVEMGAWALEATVQELPLATLLARHAGAAPRSHVSTGIALGMHASTRALVERAESAWREGYARIKLKIEPGQDVEPVRAVRERLGDAAVLTVDANSSYSLADASHVAALRELDTMNLAMIEQPLAHDDLAQHAALQAMLATRLCLDESIAGAADAAAAIALGSARVVNLKPGRVGGLTEALAVHALCVEAGAALWCGGMLETGIGRAYNVALASLPGFTEAGDLSPSARYWTHDVVTPPWTMDERGQVAVPLHRPGLGVDVDVAMIENLTVRAQVLEAR